MLSPTPVPQLILSPQQQRDYPQVHDDPLQRSPLKPIPVDINSRCADELLDDDNSRADIIRDLAQRLVEDRHIGDASPFVAALMGVPSYHAHTILTALRSLTAHSAHVTSQLTHIGSAHAALQQQHITLTATVSECRDNISELDKRRWETEMRRRALEAEATERERKSRESYVALEKKMMMVANRDKQYRHECRKKDIDYERIQDRLVKAVNANKENRAFELNGRIKVRPQTENHERINQLTTENASLRESLRRLEQELNEALAAHHCITDSTRDIDSTNVTEPLSPNSLAALTAFNVKQLALPYKIVSDSVENGLRTRIRILKTKIQTSSQHNDVQHSQCDVHTKTITEMSAHINELMEVINEQHTLLHRHVLSLDAGRRQLSPSTRRLSVCAATEDERRQIQDAQSHLRRAQVELRADRIKLDGERHKLELQRHQIMRSRGQSSSYVTPIKRMTTTKTSTTATRQHNAADDLVLLMTPLPVTPSPLKINSGWTSDGPMIELLENE